MKLVVMRRKGYNIPHPLPQPLQHYKHSDSEFLGLAGDRQTLRGGVSQEWAQTVNCWGDIAREVLGRVGWDRQTLRDAS